MSPPIKVLLAVTLGIHVASAVVGFGMVALSGLYASWGAKPGAGRGPTDLRQFFGSPNLAARSLWAVPFTGALALSLDRGLGALTQGWALGAAACWVVAMIATARTVWPGEERIRHALAASPGGSADGEEEAARFATQCRPIIHAAAWCDVLFVVALALMVLKPGQ